MTEIPQGPTENPPSYTNQISQAPFQQQTLLPQQSSIIESWVSSTPTIEWDIFDFYQFDILKTKYTLLPSKSSKVKDEQERAKRLSLSPRFATLDLWRQQAILQIVMDIMKGNIDRLGGGMEEMTEEEIRGFIRVEVIRLRL